VVSATGTDLHRVTQAALGTTAAATFDLTIAERLTRFSDAQRGASSTTVIRDPHARPS
jgi:hypothetical protein